MRLQSLCSFTPRLDNVIDTHEHKSDFKEW